MAETCTLVPGLFGVLVQFLLLAISLAVLVVKKLKDTSDRTWPIFMLDSSKQVLGAGFIHVLNLLSSTILGSKMEGDACDWYWMNIMVDTTLGVFVLYLWLQGLTHALEYLIGDGAEIRFGEYDDEDGEIDQQRYLQQLGLWFSCIIGMKIVVFLILLLLANPLYNVAFWILLLVSWDTQLKLTFVMVLTPCCMNALQFWVTDHFIQKGGVTCSEARRGCLNCCSSFRKCLAWLPVKKDSRKDSHGDPSSQAEQGHGHHTGHGHTQDNHANPFDDHHTQPHSSLSHPLLAHDDHAHAHDNHAHGGHDNQTRPHALSTHSVQSAHSTHAQPPPARRHSNSLTAVLGTVAPLWQEADVHHVEADPFKAERAAYVQQSDQLRFQMNELSAAAAKDRKDKDDAKVQAKLNEEQMLDAKEQLHKIQQELRLHVDEKQLLRDRLSVKEEREQQLLLRVQQLEFSYSAAGAAANAVFAAEVSAASVVASNTVTSVRRTGMPASASMQSSPMQSTPMQSKSTPRRTGAGETEAVSTIDEFLGQSKALSPAPPSPVNLRA